MTWNKIINFTNFWELQDEAASTINLTYSHVRMVDLQKLPTNCINQGLNAEKATTELCPPNPNEFDMAGKIYTKLSWVNFIYIVSKANCR